MVEADHLKLDGNDLLKTSETEMRAVRGQRISMVMQDPKFSLNPVMRVADRSWRPTACTRKPRRPRPGGAALAMLEAVSIRDPERVFRAYPHELSGGMGQRIMIAMMLIPDPELLIADEPTSALDVTVQVQVLNIIDKLVRERGMGLIFISHDLNLVASVLRPGADHVCRPRGRDLRRRPSCTRRSIPTRGAC